MVYYDGALNNYLLRTVQNKLKILGWMKKIDKSGLQRFVELDSFKLKTNEKNFKKSVIKKCKRNRLAWSIDSHAFFSQNMVKIQI